MDGCLCAAIPAQLAMCWHEAEPIRCVVRQPAGSAVRGAYLRCAIPPRTLRKRSGGETTHRCWCVACSRRGLMTRRRCVMRREPRFRALLRAWRAMVQGRGGIVRIVLFNELSSSGVRKIDAFSLAAHHAGSRQRARQGLTWHLRVVSHSHAHDGGHRADNEHVWRTQPSHRSARTHRMALCSPKEAPAYVEDGPLD